MDDSRLSNSPGRGVATAPDVLAAVFTALGRPSGPAMVQVLVRPVIRRRLGELDRAARGTTKPRVPLTLRIVGGLLNLLLSAIRFVLSMVVELITPTRTTRYGGGYRYHDPYEPRRPDRLETVAMRQAAEKLAAGPHVLATIRAGAARPDRASATAAARSIAGGFATVARHLHPSRIWNAGSVLRWRRVRRGEWLLLSTDELAVLAHPAPCAATGRSACPAPPRTPHAE